jgi:hypothetical protein
VQSIKRNEELLSGPEFWPVRGKRGDELEPLQVEVDSQDQEAKRTFKPNSLFLTQRVRNALFEYLKRAQKLNSLVETYGQRTLKPNSLFMGKRFLKPNSLFGDIGKRTFKPYGFFSVGRRGQLKPNGFFAMSNRLTMPMLLEEEATEEEGNDDDDFEEVQDKDTLKEKQSLWAARLRLLHG